MSADSKSTTRTVKASPSIIGYYLRGHHAGMILGCSGVVPEAEVLSETAPAYAYALGMYDGILRVRPRPAASIAQELGELLFGT